MTTQQAKIIDGKAVAEALRATVASRVAVLKANGGPTPGLAVVLVGSDPASQVYVRNKNKQTLEAGMNSFEHPLPEDTSEADVLALVAALNADPKVNGILVQLPLPKQIDAQKVIDAIDPAKDVDGFHPANVGRLATGGDALVPCTPLGCLLLLKRELGNLSGRKAIVLGRSNIVGKPMVQLLLRESCTVTVAHSRTQDLPGECRQADIVVAAVGQPEMVKADWIKPGAVVIDVGINRVPSLTDPTKTRLVGDVATAEVAKVAGAITPVPGGVGPMTIAVLLRNTLEACCRQNGLPFEEVL
jgi:methylenetetrahydrofolate dehydrogenase (NADP+)/methenyltetrahydrofolate cyclohydrolase